MDKLRISTKALRQEITEQEKEEKEKIRCFTKSTLERQMEAGDQAATKKYS